MVVAAAQGLAYQPSLVAAMSLVAVQSSSWALVLAAMAVAVVRAAGQQAQQ